MTIVYLPDGPTAYFKLSSIELSKKISVSLASDPHYSLMLTDTRAMHERRNTFPSSS